ncbi:MAG: hypothetical protein CV087_08755 [Candidatus Brocadia sp. WS118]|nr:MAG: hypothetical protein CV087_08755 [Candidatus Brocadia sp. WS118]
MEDSVKINVYKMKADVDEFLDATATARLLSERDRDYYDHKQWTAEEIERIKKRGQAPIVVNRVKPKIDGLLGLLSMRSSDPKAFPRTQKHEKSAEAVTDGLRFVTDNNDFEDTKQAVAKDFFIEGYGGVIVDVKQKADDIIIDISRIPWDRIYFDPKSIKRDFSDARYMGYVQWLDEDQMAENYTNVSEDKINEVINGAALTSDTTFEDKPRWIDRKNRRALVATHFYKKGGVWWTCTFTEGLFLIDPMESPYLDDEGDPACIMEIVCAYIDRDNNRYGEVRGFIDQQDEINHRRSKALHLLSQRQTAARIGAIRDVAALKRELSKPNGHIEYQGEKGDFEILQTGDMARGQFELYQDAKSELDAASFNAQLSGDRQQGTLSGVAINRLQQAGSMELNGLFQTLNGWEKRVYRQIWGRIKQFWSQEKWVRVTDDINSLRWVGFNTPITVQQWLEETINDKSMPEPVRKQAAASYMALMQREDPSLEQIMEIRNPAPEIMVDIILEQSFDVVNIQQEQFEMLAKFAGQGSGIDIIDLIQLSQLRGKDEVIERIKKSREDAMQAQGGAQQLQLQQAQAKTAETASKAAVNEQNAQQKQIENAILMARPADIQPQVAV